MVQRLLCVSDMHDAYGRYQPSALPDADAVLIGGDFTNYGDRDMDKMEVARAWMQQLAARYARIFYVCGNHDFGLDNETFRSKTGNIVGAERRYADCLGWSLYGASLSTCFNAPRLAEHWCRMTASPKEDTAEWDDVAYADIILSHSPPKGVLDAGGGVFDRTIGRWKEESLGSPGLLNYLNRHRPKLVVCGHIHEAKGIVRLAYPDSDAETLVVNCAQYPVLVTISEDCNAWKAHVLRIAPTPLPPPSLRERGGVEGTGEAE